MQTWKPAVKGEKFLARSEDGKIEIYSVQPKQGNRQDMIMAVFKGVSPDTSYPDRFDIMSEANWNTILNNVDSLRSAFSGILAAKEQAAKEKAAKLLETVETINKTGLPAVARRAALSAQLAAEQYQDSDIKTALELVK